MEWVVVCVCMLVLLICAGAVMLSHGEEEEDHAQAVQGRQGGVSDAREAYYMANFWSYDGSEQQDWDE